MNPLKKTTVLLVSGVLAIELAAACMESSTAPTATRTATTAIDARTAQPNSLTGTTSIVSGVVRLGMKLLRIVGSVGGSLANGRWRVDLAAGAIDGTATIGLGVASSTSASCQLDILPADKNHFSAPVRLTVDCANVPQDQLKGYVIYRFDPAANVWAPVQGSTVDLAKKTVSAPLSHFSTYAVGPSGGKAGW